MGLKNIHYYIRISIVLLLLFILIITPISILLSKQFSKYAYNEINRFTQVNTHQTIERVDSLLERMKFFSFSIYTDKRIQQYLSLKTIDPSVHREVQVTLSNYLLNEPFIHSVYAVNVSNQTIFDSRRGPSTSKNFYDQSILTKLNDENQLLTYFRHENSEGAFLSLIIKGQFDYKGFLVVLLDIEKLEKFLLPNHHDIDMQMTLVNSQGELLLGGGKESHFLRGDSGSFVNKEEQFELKVLDSHWLVNYSALESYDIGVYTLTNINSWDEKIARFNSKVIISAFMLVFILFLIVLFGNRKLYHPFTKMAEYLRDKFSSDFQQDTVNTDYSVIKQGIDFLEGNVNEMTKSITEYKHVVRNEYLRQWIVIGEVDRSIKYYSKDEVNFISNSNMYLAVIRVEAFQLFLEKYTLVSRKLMQYAMGNIAKEIIKEKEKSCEIEAVDIDNDHIVLLIGLKKDNQVNLNKALMIVKDQIKEYLDLDVSVAISDVRDNTVDLRSVYNKIYEASKLKFITGENRVYQENDMDHYLSMLRTGFDELIVEKLIQSVRFSNENKVLIILDEIMDKIKQLSYKECRFQLSLIMYRLISSYNLYTSFSGVEGIETQLGKFGTIDELRQWLEDELKHIMKNLHQGKSSNRKVDVANEINDYIDTHIQNPSLSIDMIADHLSLSVSYTRQVYKEVHGITIFDFIVNKRIENVIKLLRTSDWNIEEISKHCGFQTRSNFYTVFKKNVGMTPSEYRESHKIS